MERDHLVVILERVEGKLDLVVEGHSALQAEIQALAQKTDERFDLVDFKINVLNEKIDSVEEKLLVHIASVEQSLGKQIDAVATDLKAHRFDTEAHQKGYRVREE